MNENVSLVYLSSPALSGCRKSQDCERAGMEQYAVALEMGPKRRVFAQVLASFGWCRAGKYEMTALNLLATTASTYAKAVERAGLPFVTPSSIQPFHLIRRVP